MDDQSSEEKINETGSDSLFTRLYRPGPLIAIFSIVFIGLLSLGYYILTEDTPPPEVLKTEDKAPKPQKTPQRIYEEEYTSEMEDNVKQVDLSIIETMRDLKLDMRELDLVDVEIRRLNGRGYHFQTLQIPSVADRNQYLRTLRKRLHRRIPLAVLLDNGLNEAAVEISGLQTHRLLLESIPLKIPKPTPKGPKLVLVIDDVGENFGVLKGLIGLDIPITYAVWPHATNTRSSVELISQNKQELIIHFPMEPKGYPKVNPGDDALFVEMTAEQIQKQVTENLGRIPEATGVNNHMGSRFTAYSPGMDIALAEFKSNGLFFLDSLTSPKSVGRKSAQRVGIPFYERDIFLDNVKDISAIIHQLKKAEQVALSKGFSIAIGHPYKETLAAIKQWNKQRNESIQLTSLSRIAPE